MSRCLSFARMLALWLCAAHAAAQSVDDRTLRFEPPSVDKVYPPPSPDEGPPAAPSEPATPGEHPPPPPPAAPPEPAPETSPERVPAPPAPSEAPERRPSAAPESLLPQGVPAEPPEGPAPPEAEPLIPQYGASARTRHTDTGRRELDLAETRDLPGVFGDPLRAVELMPGVVPVSNGLPYFYLRGSPPASQGYRFDNILLPQIYHLGIGPQVLHPRMVNRVDFYGAVGPSNYGRRTGALIDTGAHPHSYTTAGELELRLLDVNGFVETPALGGNLQVAGRYGYPGLVLKAFSPKTNLDYWDGQLRYEVPLDSHNRLQLVWLGSYDKLDRPPFGTGAAGTSSAMLHFERVLLRALHDTHHGQLGASVRFGFDHSSLGTALTVRAFTVGPRVFYRGRFGHGHRVQAGGSMYASTGHLEDKGGTISGFNGQLPVNLPSLADASARNQGGVYGEVTLLTSDNTTLRAGGRLDFWKVRSVVNIGIDPRLRFNWTVTEGTDLHIAAGMAHQPTVFLLPLPGLSQVALSRSLSTSYQLEAGVHQELPGGIEVSATPYLNYQTKLLLPETVVDGQIAEDPPLVNARAVGLELFARGSVAEKLHFIASYTLGYGKAFSPPNVLGTFRPNFDVRHVLNLSIAYWFPSGFNIGVRLGARSGRLIEQKNARYAQRLPWFTRLDARIGYQWQGRWALMDAYLGWLNIAARPEYIDANCFFGQCQVNAAPPIFAPNLGVRATFGKSKAADSGSAPQPTQSMPVY